ncbi:MAG: YbfB/YjiJ family MFS transporter [Oxalobacteraceae bacterium]
MDYHAKATTLEHRPLAIALTGTLSLAVAMGIGRFAFTPLMPMMLRDGLLDLDSASWLASTNYIGYLLGALLCAVQPSLWKRAGWPALASPGMVRGGLSLTCVLTAAMALQVPAAWPWLRFFAGLVTSFAFVFTSSWCLGHLSRLHAPTAGGVVYAGPGVGIASSGLLAGLMVQLGWHATSGWLALALLATLMTAIVWRAFDAPDARIAAAVSTHPGVGTSGSLTEKSLLTLAYGLSGFGYIITATFLPVIARTALPDSVWPDFFWPMLGIGVALGALLASRIPSHIDQRLLLVLCYLMQSAGVVLSNWIPDLAGFAIGSLLVGLPFTAITFFAMQIGRRLHPDAPSAIIGLLSAAFGLGQIVGPPMAAALIARAPSTAAGFSWSLDIAALSLLIGALMYYGMSKRFPAPH